MDKALRWIDSRRPELIVQGILATVLIVTGLYVASPWYITSQTTAVGVALELYWVRFGVGIFYITSSIITFYGLFKDSVRWRRHGTLFMFMSCVFIVLLRLITFGILPLHWIPWAGLAAVASVMRIIEFRKLSGGK